MSEDVSFLSSWAGGAGLWGSEGLGFFNENPYSCSSFVSILPECLQFLLDQGRHALKYNPAGKFIFIFRYIMCLYIGVAQVLSLMRN